MQENESQSTFLARISKFEPNVDVHGCLTMAQVVPTTSPDIVTRPFPIHWTCRGKLGDLNVGDLVICSRFSDGSGIVWSRADGNHSNIFPDGLTVDGDAHITQTLVADVDVVGGGTSLKGHTHTGVHGGTSAPN